jgi:hypothetical protein
MKKVFNWVWLVLYSLLPIYFITMLLVSAFGSYKITELVDYNWWLFFFVFEIWFNTVGSKRIEDGWEKIKGE